MGLTRSGVVAAFEKVEARSFDVELPPRSLVVDPLSRSTKSFAALDSDGCWALVVASRKPANRIPALRLNALTADYGTNYELHQDTAVEQLRVCVIRCTSDDPTVRLLFATFCVALIDQIPAEPSDSDIETQVSKWVAMFRRLQAPARSTVIGLIGELTMLDCVDRVSDWTRAWHSASIDNLDFAFASPPLSVEVKATSSQQRVHEVSIHQTTPLVTQHHHFASVIVELRESGDRLGSVVDEIVERLGDTAAIEKFWSSLANVCGASLGDYLEVRFMRDVARKSLRIYRAESIPRPIMELPLPAGVSGVHFRSDFSSVEPIDPTPILEFAATT